MEPCTEESLSLSLSSSQDSETIHACLAGDVLLSGHESTLVTLRFARVHDVREGICEPESLKCKLLCMASA